MIRSYLITAYRNMLRSGLSSIINVFGLALGLACTVYILLWVQDELSWDRFHSRIHQLYRVYMNRPGEGGTFTQTVVPLALWDELRAARGIEHVSPTNTGTTVTLEHGKTRTEKSCLYAGEDFLKMFDFKIVGGSADGKLGDASSIVLTRSTARALFGDQLAVGKVIRMDNRADLTVSTVVEDPPHNSTIQFDCLIPFKVIMALEPWYKSALNKWDNSSFYMYVELQSGVTVPDLDPHLREVIKDHDPDSKAELLFFPLQDSRLYSRFENGESVGGSVIYVRIFTVVAFLILAIACINFTNLTTARSENRAKEVGIRKASGSSRKQLIVQFLTETFLTTLLAFLITVGLVQGLLPAYNRLVNKPLSIDYTSPAVWAVAIAFLLFTALASGIYPAFFLSAFRPIRALRGRLATGKSGKRLRQVMVTLQFFFSIGLVLTSIVIYEQLEFAKHRDIGYDGSHLLMVPATGEISKHYDAIRNELVSKSLASSVTFSSSPVTDIYSWSRAEWQGQRDDQKDFFGIISIGADYAETLHTSVIEGREFGSIASDSSRILLNEAAVDYMDLKDPVGKNVRFNDREYTVVGVLKDMVMTSPFAPTTRTVFFSIPGWMSHVLIRLPENRDTHVAIKEIEGVFKAHNPAFPFSYSFADEEFDRKFQNEEMLGDLSKIFSALAIVISCLGLYGLSAFAAEQRTKEVGIRRVLGASAGSILILFSRDFSKLVLLAFILSAPITWWFMNEWLQHYTYRVTLTWWMPALAGLFALVLTWIIVGIQAARAATANPTASLRNE
jgi:ABC-type antimicrobial peptide transport system permease subunit